MKTMCKKIIYNFIYVITTFMVQTRNWSVEDTGGFLVTALEDLCDVIK